VRAAARYGLYLVTDRAACLGRDLLSVIAAAVAGGVGLVQLREKTAGTREFVELAVAVKALLAPLGVPLLINDRIDVALAANADGAHVGQDDMPAAMARALLGPDRLLGVSTHDATEALAAAKYDVDYLGVGPIYATATKPDAKAPIGPGGLAAIKAAVSLPLIGIGGIGADNAAAVIRAGASAVAVVSAICSAGEPEAAARSILEAVRGARG
jgi:thiamine-phosphate pyrophosphorylase